MRSWPVLLLSGLFVVACSPVGESGSSAVVSPSVVVMSSRPTATASASPSSSPLPSVGSSLSSAAVASPSSMAVESFPAAPATESSEQAAVRAAWMEYWDVYQTFAADPWLPDWSETQRITTGDQSTLIVQELGLLKDNGVRLIGGLQFREVVVGQPREGADGKSEAVMTYCVDRSSIVLVDAETEEPIKVEGPMTLAETVTLQLGKDGKWRVALMRNEARAC